MCPDHKKQSQRVKAPREDLHGLFGIAETGIGGRPVIPIVGDDNIPGVIPGTLFPVLEGPCQRDIREGILPLAELVEHLDPGIRGHRHGEVVSPGAVDRDGRQHLDHGLAGRDNPPHSPVDHPLARPERQSLDRGDTVPVACEHEQAAQEDHAYQQEAFWHLSSLLPLFNAQKDLSLTNHPDTAQAIVPCGRPSFVSAGQRACPRPRPGHRPLRPRDRDRSPSRPRG